MPSCIFFFIFSQLHYLVLYVQTHFFITGISHFPKNFWFLSLKFHISTIGRFILTEYLCFLGISVYSAHEKSGRNKILPYNSVVKNNLKIHLLQLQDKNQNKTKSLSKKTMCKNFGDPKYYLKSNF